jgi:glycosyltransferase involved in cell wall biosynthesis
VRLLYAGRLQPEKGIDQVLDVLPGFLGDGGVELTIAGAGPLASRVAGITHPGVRHVGYVQDPAAMHVLLREHDVLLAPSATETFGLTALEAMAAGLVVVGADLGGMGDLMRQSASPFMFRSGDRADLLRAVRAAIGADRRDPAARGRAVAERHGTWDDAIARQVSVYEAKHGLAAAAGRRAAARSGQAVSALNAETPCRAERSGMAARTASLAAATPAPHPATAACTNSCMPPHSTSVGPGAGM